MQHVDDNEGEIKLAIKSRSVPRIRQLHNMVVSDY